MPRTPGRTPGEPAPAPIDAVVPDDPEPVDEPERTGVGIRADFADLPVLGFSRRRVGWAIGVVLAAWIMVVFARQVGEASAASTRAEDLAAANRELAAHVEALERELTLIQEPEFIAVQARGQRIGAGREVPFQLADDAEPLRADAPGSASTRLGAAATRRTPLEAWLELLFGPDA